jgi:hypothetical protein
LIGGDLDVDDEGSEQRFELMQSLHHGSVGYQLMHTLLDLAKKAKSLHAQLRTLQAQLRTQAGQRRSNLNCGSMIKLESWGLTNQMSV